VPPPEKPNRLLVVDDEPIGLRALSRRLESRGYDVETADGGLAALDKILADHYDLILLDHNMPDMTGLDLLKLLRATHSQAELPVIMVTCLDDDRDIAEALHEGANDYLIKPVEMPEILVRIEAQLAKAQRARIDAEDGGSTAPSNKRATLDPLTGLGNRQHLQNAVAAALGARAGPDESWRRTWMLLLLDVNGFRDYNEQFGHQAGDRLLIRVADRLRSAVASSRLAGVATLAHYGSDEFAVLAPCSVDGQDAGVFAETLLAALAETPSRAGGEGPVSANIGIALSDMAGGGLDQILTNAELALQAAQAEGPDRWHLSAPDLRERARIRAAVSRDFRLAVENNELVALYQPQIDLVTRQVSGFEALMRWRHPVRGLILPADFIPIAEETGMIVPAGAWILGEACRQLKTWRDQFPGNPITVGVNISPRQLKDAQLLSHLRRVLEETGESPNLLDLEITESSAIVDDQFALRMLAAIRETGVRLTLDDFGTGYASLTCLHMVHFDALKIDRSFVARMEEEESLAIVKTILRLAHELRMSVIAEGIESEAQLMHLVRLGCKSGQGFHFSRPAEACAAGEFLHCARAVEARESFVA